MTKPPRAGQVGQVRAGKTVREQGEESRPLSSRYPELTASFKLYVGGGCGLLPHPWDCSLGHRPLCDGF